MCNKRVNIISKRKWALGLRGRKLWKDLFYTEGRGSGGCQGIREREEVGGDLDEDPGRECYRFGMEGGQGHVEFLRKRDRRDSYGGRRLKIASCKFALGERTVIINSKKGKASGPLQEGEFIRRGVISSSSKKGRQEKHVSEKDPHDNGGGTEGSLPLRKELGDGERLAETSFYRAFNVPNKEHAAGKKGIEISITNQGS